jgi:2',3'-cyclic-nucleotide 2'-phosphodiesterase (5'-nucleotidase family)
MGAGTSIRSASIPEVVTEADAQAIIGSRWPALKPNFLESLGDASGMSKPDFLAFVVDSASNHGRGDTIDDGACMVRVIHVNDVYDLKSLPHLKTLVDRWTLPRGHRTLVTCGGGFLAPSLLSGLDHGAGMVDCLNALPTDYVCFGNHECDVPHASLLERIDEFKGTWLNTNMPEITDPPLPPHDIIELVSANGSHVRRLGFIGLLCGYPTLYRPGAFNGKVHTIEDPEKAALRAAQAMRPVSINRADGMPFSDPEGLYFGPLDAQGRPHGYGELRIDSSESILNRFQGEFRDGEMWEGIMIDWTEDVEKPNLAAIQTADILGYYHAVMREGAWVENPSQEALESASAKMKRAEQEKVVDALIPLTHLDQKDDVRLAEALTKSAPLPVPAILGGHDHGTTVTQVNKTKIAKAGMDAAQAVILDVVWKSPEDDAPQTRILMEPVDQYQPEAEMARRVERHLTKVKALEHMVLQRFDQPQSSEGSRKGPSSVAQMLCGAICRQLDCDACVLDGGSVRGNATYATHFSFADLRAELPYEHHICVVGIPGQVLSDAVKFSRDMLKQVNSRGYAFFLQCDDMMEVDKNNAVTMVAKKPLNPEKIYQVAIEMDLGFGAGANEPLKAYAAENPDCVPVEGAGIPAKRIVLGYFVMELWRRLPTFDTIDVDRSGTLTNDEVQQAYAKAFINGDESELARQAAEQMAKELIASMDVNKDGFISREEYTDLMGKAARRALMPLDANLLNNEVEEEIEIEDSDYLEPHQLLLLKPMPKKEHWSPADTPNVLLKNDLHRRAWRSNLHGKRYF